MPAAAPGRSRRPGPPRSNAPPANARATLSGPFLSGGLGDSAGRRGGCRSIGGGRAGIFLGRRVFGLGLPAARREGEHGCWMLGLAVAGQGLLVPVHDGPVGVRLGGREAHRGAVGELDLDHEEAELVGADPAVRRCGPRDRPDGARSVVAVESGRADRASRPFDTAVRLGSATLSSVVGDPASDSLGTGNVIIALSPCTGSSASTWTWADAGALPTTAPRAREVAAAAVMRAREMKLLILTRNGLPCIAGRSR